MKASGHIEHGVLYFPYIGIWNGAWLKSTLRIWDSVYRIVPLGYKPKDSDEVREAIDAGFIKDIRLSIDVLVREKRVDAEARDNRL